MKRLKALILLAVLLGQQLTIFAAYREIYVQPSGSNMNAGSTDTDAATVTYAGGDWDASTDVFTAAVGADMTEAVVGRWAALYHDGDTTPTANQYLVARITVVNSGTREITLSTSDRALSGTEVATSTADNRTLKIGGAWAGPSAGVGFPFGFVVAAFTDSSASPILPARVNFKGGTTYNITAAITHANNGPIFWEGYTTSVGDGGFAYFNGDSASPTAPYTMLTVSGTGNFFKNLWFDDNGGTTAAQSVGNNTMVDITGTANRVYRVRVSNAYRFGLRIGGAGTQVIECEGYGNNRDDAANFANFGVFEESEWKRVVSHSSTYGTDSAGYVIGSDSAENVSFEDCVAYNLGSYGWQLTGNHHSVSWDNCLAYDCDGGGIFSSGAIATASQYWIENSLFINNGAWGIQMNNSGHRSAPWVVNCGFYNNTSGTIATGHNTSFVSGTLTFSGDPIVSASTGNFALDSTAGEGADARNAGIGSFLINTSVLSTGTTAYPDLGPVQHDDTGGGGGGGGTRVYIGQ